MRLNFFFFGLFYNENRKNIWWYMVTYHMPKKTWAITSIEAKVVDVRPTCCHRSKKNPTTVTITDALPISNRCCFIRVSVGSFNCHKIQKTFFSLSLSLIIHLNWCSSLWMINGYFIHSDAYWLEAVEWMRNSPRGLCRDLTGSMMMVAGLMSSVVVGHKLSTCLPNVLTHTHTHTIQL